MLHDATLDVPILACEVSLNCLHPGSPQALPATLEALCTPSAPRVTKSREKKSRAFGGRRPWENSQATMQTISFAHVSSALGFQILKSY